MHSQKGELQKDKRIIINWLAHHDPKRDDFNDHVFYIFNYAVCIGCFAFLMGATFSLIIGNIFYYFIVNFISLPIIFLVFFLCWAPVNFSIFDTNNTKKTIEKSSNKIFNSFTLSNWQYPIYI